MNCQCPKALVSYFHNELFLGISKSFSTVVLFLPLCTLQALPPRLNGVAKFINAVSAKIYEQPAVFFVLPRRSTRACIE